jgi:hypothetical protein
MKQFDIKAQREIDGVMFYVRPFPAFKAANLTGELAALVVPIFGALAPALADKGVENSRSLLNMDAAEAAPLLASGAASLSGDKVESLLRKLLTKHGNITVELAEGGGPQKLTDDIADEVFCGNAQDMFVLAFEVIKVNYSGFFERASALFGGALSDMTKRI